MPFHRNGLLLRSVALFLVHIYAAGLLTAPVAALAAEVTFTTARTSSASTAPLAAQSDIVRIPVGTVVELVFDQMVSPNTTAAGQRVALRVANAVTINGKTVIAAGSSAVGEVITASKAGAVGKEAQLVVAIRSVPAVDGSVVPLDGTKAVTGENKTTSSVVITLLCCILGLLQQGGKADIPAGSSVRATVAAPIDVTLQ